MIKLFTKPLELVIDGETFRFPSVKDFEFCVSGRTNVPSRKIAEITGYSIQQIRDEAHAIKEVEEQFISILTASIKSDDNIGKLIGKLDASIFSQDHNWRDIIKALSKDSSEYEPFVKVALVNYMQYLSSRQDLIKYIYAEKIKLSSTPDSSEVQTGNNPLGETLILLPDPLDEENVTSNSLMRMPKGKSISTILPSDEHIKLMLSKYECAIEASDHIYFVDQAKGRHILKPGVNVVGRSATGAVIIDPKLRDISRQHLLIKNMGDNRLQLTDLSSHGTYIPASIMKNPTD